MPIKCFLCEKFVKPEEVAHPKVCSVLKDKYVLTIEYDITGLGWNKVPRGDIRLCMNCYSQYAGLVKGTDGQQMRGGNNENSNC